MRKDLGKIEEGKDKHKYHANFFEYTISFSLSTLINKSFRVIRKMYKTSTVISIFRMVIKFHATTSAA